MFFYIIENIDYCVPSWVNDLDCCYVKGSSDKTKSAIIFKSEIDYEATAQEQMQVVLDSWIDDENEIAPIDDVTGEKILQSKINLSSIVDWYGGV